MQNKSIGFSNYPILLATQQRPYDYAVHSYFDKSFLSNPYALHACCQRYNKRFYDEPKPSYSYIGLIAMAILSSSARRLVLSDIYQWILDHYPYFRGRGPGWRNSIRHNLSLNDCFVKADRSANGKGHYWSIHPANLSDFIRGDFRRRRAQRRVSKSLGLIVPDNEDGDEEEEEEILPMNKTESYFEKFVAKDPIEDLHSNTLSIPYSVLSSERTILSNLQRHYFADIPPVAISCFQQHLSPTKLIHLDQDPTNENCRKRCFDVDSLLAPEQPCIMKRQRYHLKKHEEIHDLRLKSNGSTETETSA